MSKFTSVSSSMSKFTSVSSSIEFFSNLLKNGFIVIIGPIEIDIFNDEISTILKPKFYLIGR